LAALGATEAPGRAYARGYRGFVQVPRGPGRRRLQEYDHRRAEPDDRPERPRVREEGLQLRGAQGRARHQEEGAPYRGQARERLHRVQVNLALEALLTYPSAHTHTHTHEPLL
jgi:hypothetical protein